MKKHVTQRYQDPLCEARIQRGILLLVDLSLTESKVIHKIKDLKDCHHPDENLEAVHDRAHDPRISNYLYLYFWTSYLDLGKTSDSFSGQACNAIGICVDLNWVKLFS